MSLLAILVSHSVEYSVSSEGVKDTECVFLNTLKTHRSQVSQVKYKYLKYLKNWLQYYSN